jgi:hypothetical protein
MQQQDNIITCDSAFDSIKGTSIFDIIYDAFNKHYDVTLSLDAIISQFFSIFELCEKHNVFGETSQKELVTVIVDRQMNEKELEQLPKQFIDKINLKAYDLEKYSELLHKVMGNKKIGTHIFALAGMSKRYEFLAHTLCKNPNITIDAKENEVKDVLNLMYQFTNLPVASKKSKSDYEYDKYYEALKFYYLLMNKIYEKQYLGRDDAKFFYNLIQKNSGSGGPVKGYIKKLESMPHTAVTKVKRQVLETSYPDLMYYGKLVTKNVNNVLYFDVVHSVPKQDTTLLQGKKSDRSQETIMRSLYDKNYSDDVRKMNLNKNEEENYTKYFDLCSLQ